MYLASQKQQLYELFVRKIPLHNHFSLLFISQNSFPLSATTFFGFSPCSIYFETWLEININERHDSERSFPTELLASQGQIFTAKCSLRHLRGRQRCMNALAENVVTLNRFFSANALAK